MTSAHPQLRLFVDGHILAFPIRKCGYFVKVKEIKWLRGDVACIVAHGTTPFDAEIGEIDHFWMETK